MVRRLSLILFYVIDADNIVALAVVHLSQIVEIENDIVEMLEIKNEIKKDKW